MSKTHQLIDKVKEARNAYLRAIQRVSEAKGLWKPSVNEWNIIEITEHLYWAEHGGIFGMWKTLYAIRAGEAERVAAIRAGEQGRGASSWQFRSRHHSGDRVEDVPLRLLERLRRQRPIARLAHVRAEPGHDVADRLIGSGRRFERRRLRRGGFGRRGQRRGRNHPACALQDVAARHRADFWQRMGFGMPSVLRHGCKSFRHEDTKKAKPNLS